jgi:hypothetical protein
MSLEAFTYHTANKYCHGQFTADLDFGYTVHNVILVGVFFPYLSKLNP